MIEIAKASSLLAPPSLDAAAARVGGVIQGFRLIRLLGTGPITAAYEARRESTGEPGESRVTLKLMHPLALRVGSVRAQFIRGAYAANRFRHARVLPIIMDGEDESGTPFVQRAWNDAEPLEQWAAKARRPPQARVLLRIAEQVLDALEIAHAHGIVHAAVSPRNILVTSRGTVRLVDFASPSVIGFPEVLEVDVLSRLRLGPFTAPERLLESASPPDEQGDVYSVGASLFFALTGFAPPDAGHVGAGTGPLEASLARVVGHAMEKNPRDRYPSAYAMLGDVRRVMAGRPPKLAGAEKPVPTGIGTGRSSVERAARYPETGQFVPTRPAIDDALQSSRREWPGNVVLIVAIALLIGVATFVIVHERLGERSPPTVEAH